MTAKGDKAPAPPAIRTGEALAKVLKDHIERDDTAGLRAVVLDRLRRTETWATRAFRNRRILADAIAALGKSKDLEALVRSLDQADHAAFKRFVRDHPNIYVRRVRTADHLRAYLAEHGTKPARAAFGRALREVDAPDGDSVARYVGEALERGEDGPAVDAVERLIRRFDGSPEPDEMRALRKHLDEFFLGLKKAQRLEGFARALERHGAESARRHSSIELYDMAEQLADLALHFGASEAAAVWTAARGRPVPQGGPIGAEAVKLLQEGKEAEALDLVLDELVEPLDERHGAAARPEEWIARFNDGMAVLATEGKLADLVRIATAADEAFARENPHAIFVAAKHRLRSAVDRAGNDDTKVAWKKANLER